MIIAIPKESARGECRVAATPDSVKKLIKLGYQVHIQSGAGESSCFSDDSYRSAGATIETSLDSLLAQANVVTKINPPTPGEIEKLPQGSLLISMFRPAQNSELTEKCLRRGVNVLALDCIPRISRAQKMDVLSSMANIAGYRAIVEAASAFPSFFTGQITAAGKVPPAKVLVIGAGVAGLAAIGAARGLGAIVRAFDTRPAVKEQVQSMGAEFLELDFSEDGEGAGGYAKVMSPEFIKKEMELFAAQAKEVDIIVTTALIPGKPAPRLITVDMVRSMKPGSVIVDMAAEQGGNCELTKPGEKIVSDNGVTIIGYADLPSRLPTQSSCLFANNLVNLLTDLTPAKDGNVVLDLKDEVVRQSLVTFQGQKHWGTAAASPPPPAPAPANPGRSASAAGPANTNEYLPLWQSPQVMAIAVVVLAALLLGVSWIAPPGFVGRLTIFCLACLVGWQVIWSVTPALHTPLMSVTNAISGIIIVGGMLQMLGPWYSPPVLLASVAVLLASINVAGGFLVTQRMLKMFRK